MHVVPSGAAGFEQAPVAGAHVPATWHWSLAVQVTGLAPVQLPAWQLSVRVQALPSLQDVPSVAAGFEQAPVVGLQVPATWHWSLGAQVTGAPPVQAPAWQLSFTVQALPSLHAVPFVAAGFEQVPVVELQVPATWHGSLAAQVTAVPAAQVPA